jgi:hypothetical protein
LGWTFFGELKIPFAILGGYSEGGSHSHMASALLVLKKCANFLQLSVDRQA